MLPNFLLIGAPKSGSSSLFGYLGQHPEIYTSRPKEPEFLYWSGTGDRPHLILPNGRREDGGTRFPGAEGYAKLFNRVTTEKAIGEGSMAYIYSPHAAEVARELLGSPRILAVLRDPVSRARSHFTYNVSLGIETAPDLESALQDESRRAEAGVSWPLQYRMQGFYGRHLQAWYERFPDSHIKVILFDDLVAHPGRTLADVYGFLEVDPGFEPDTSTRFNVTRSVHNRGLRRLMRQSPIKTFIKSVMPRQIRRSIKRNLLELNSGELTGEKKATMTSLSAETLDSLNLEYQQDSILLSSLTGLDTSHWYQQPRAA